MLQYDNDNVFMTVCVHVSVCEQYYAFPLLPQSHFPLGVNAFVKSFHINGSYVG